MSWEQEQARNREEVTNRSRQWSTVNDSDDDEVTKPTEHPQDAGGKEQSVRKRSRSPENSGSSSSDSSSDEGSESVEESRKKAKKDKKQHKKSSKKHKKESLSLIYCPILYLSIDPNLSHFLSLVTY